MRGWWAGSRVVVNHLQVPGEVAAGGVAGQAMVQPVGVWARPQLMSRARSMAAARWAAPEPVAFGASVAESAVGSANHPGDAAFDHGPVAPVGVGELLGVGEGPGGGEEVVVRVKSDNSAPGGGGAKMTAGHNPCSWM